jgi:AraC family transcriptional regulator
MQAFMHWLPTSGFRHASAPELEVYPPDDAAGGVLVEFWLPIVAAV